MSGGSHNRNTKQSLSHALSSLGKFKICKCPLHRNKGDGTVLPQIKFKRHGKSGTQAMCAEGKTLIDSYSHMLKRLQLLAVASPKELVLAFKDAPQKYDLLVNMILKIINDALREKRGEKEDINTYKLRLLTKLDDRLKTKETNFYDVNISPTNKQMFNEFLKDIFTRERLSLMALEQAKWTKNCFVKDSGDGKLYPIEEFIFNVSKKRELYDKDKKLTPFRINIHNTRVKGQRSSTLRGEKYLADGEYTEANRYMKLLGGGNAKMHADHFVPLALGGIHDVKNLKSLIGRKNIYKKDKLVAEAYHLLKKDMSFLSRWHRKVFQKNRDAGIEIVQEILKQSVYKLRHRVTKMSFTKKRDFIQSVYPHYKDSQIRRIIKKHFTHENKFIRNTKI